MSLTQRVWAWWSRLRVRPGSMQLDWDDAEVSQRNSSEGEVRLGWDEIEAVYVFKQDCYVVDQIRLVMGDGVGRWIEAGEDHPEFEALLAQLPQRLPGCEPKEEWFLKVAFPAFEPQWTQIYRKSQI